MIRIFIPFFYRLSASLSALRSVQSNSSVAEVWGILYNAQQSVDTILGTPWFTPAIRAAHYPGTRLLQAIKPLTDNVDFTNPRTVSAMEAFELGQALSEFETVLLNEVQNAETYFVTRKAAFDTSVLISNTELIFPSDLPTKVMASMVDIREAGKCLAFELSTAAGFHMMRAIESVLKVYWGAVANGAPHPRQKNLGAYLKQMEDKNIGNAKVRATLKQIKDLHRNPVAHEVILTLDEAISLFGIAQSVVSAMLTEIPPPATISPLAGQGGFTGTSTTTPPATPNP